MLDADTSFHHACPAADAPEEASRSDGGRRSARVLAFLANCADITVRWRPSEMLIVRLRTDDDDIEIPWHVAEKKSAFTAFATAVERMIGEAQPMDTGRTVRFAEMLGVSPGLRQAFGNLHGAVVQRA